MFQKYFHSLICFVRDHRKSEWQWQLAGTYTLGTAVGLPLVTLALVIALLVADSPYAGRTLPYFIIATLLSEVLYVLHAKRIVGFTGLYLMSLYLLLSFGLIVSVGIGAGSMVLCSCAIIFAGTLCGYMSALVPANLSILFLLAFRAAELQDRAHPAYVMSQQPTNFSAVVLLILLFHVLAAVSGSLYRLEQTRRKLKEAERNFARQKSQLADKIERQSQKLQSAESEKIRQLYRFAEVGEVSTALMHDLANNLSLLSLAIDGIKTEESGTSLRRAKSQIKQIHRVLHHTRQQLQGQYRPEVFDLVKEITRTVKLLKTPAKKARVTLTWVKPVSEESFGGMGEKILFQQLLTNIINNAIESYGQSSLKPQANRKVVVTLKAKGNSLVLAVTDWGKGIDPKDTEKVFQPFYSTKQGGMGVGLYLTKRLIEGNFGGSIELQSTKQHTVFTITLPKST